MKLPVLFVFSVLATPLFGQGALQDTATAQDQSSAQRSTLEVQPGSPVIKQKDLWDATGYLHPFVRMPKYILQDQKAIWTSPFHTVKKDLKWCAILGSATAAPIAADKSSVKVLPNSSSQLPVSTWGSRLGAACTLIPVSAAFHFIGGGWHEDRFRETGLIGFETLVDTSLMVEALKLATDRARPIDDSGEGHFWDSPNHWSSGFPSGPAITVLGAGIGGGASVCACADCADRGLRARIHGGSGSSGCAEALSRRRGRGLCDEMVHRRLRLWQTSQPRPGRKRIRGRADSGSCPSGRGSAVICD